MRITFTLFLLLHTAQAAATQAVTIRFVDAGARALVPVRVELLDGSGGAVVAENAVPVSRECAFAPLPHWLAQPPPLSIDNPYTGTRQHYVDGLGRYQLNPGVYKLRVFKGPEYRVSQQKLVVADAPLEVQVIVSRHAPAGSGSAAGGWSADSGWVSMDAHLHLSRPARQHNHHLGVWMAAEGLQIASLLQMGALTHFAAAPQYAFGGQGAYVYGSHRNGSHFKQGTLLVSGQEHPRTHLFGHALSLGAAVPVDERETYLRYNTTFAKVRAAGGINGFAHWGAGAAADGLAVYAPGGHVELLEVLSFGFLYLESWYQLLNLGFELAAVAGTDYPCLPGVPGRERTYLQVNGEVSRQAMVHALRSGRTFVSNGPLLGLSVAGQGIGGKLDLPATSTLSAAGYVRFDPARDAVQRLELVRNAEVIRAWPAGNTGYFEFREEIPADAPGWVALRASGRKLGETKPPAQMFPAWMQVAFNKWMSGGSSRELDEFIRSRPGRMSYAHTSPIYLRGAAGAGDPGADAGPWLARLQRLEQRFRNRDFADMLIWDWLPYSDGVSAEHMRANATAVLEDIRRAQLDFSRRANPP